MVQDSLRGVPSWQVLAGAFFESPCGESSHQGAKLRCETRMLLPDQLSLSRNTTGGCQERHYEADELPTQGLAQFLIHTAKGGDEIVV